MDICICTGWYGSRLTLTKYTQLVAFPGGHSVVKAPVRLQIPNNGRID